MINDFIFLWGFEKVMNALVNVMWTQKRKEMPSKSHQYMSRALLTVRIPYMSRMSTPILEFPGDGKTAPKSWQMVEVLSESLVLPILPRVSHWQMHKCKLAIFSKCQHAELVILKNTLCLMLLKSIWLGPNNPYHAYYWNIRQLKM